MCTGVKFWWTSHRSLRISRSGSIYFVNACPCFSFQCEGNRQLFVFVLRNFQLSFIFSKLYSPSNCSERVFSPYFRFTADPSPSFLLYALSRMVHSTKPLPLTHVTRVGVGQASCAVHLPYTCKSCHVTRPCSYDACRADAFVLLEIFRPPS